MNGYKAFYRGKTLDVLADMRAAIKAGLNVTPSICQALRAQLRGLIDQWEALRNEREQLDSEFHYYRDGKSLGIAQFASEYL